MPQRTRLVPRALDDMGFTYAVAVALTQADNDIVAWLNHMRLYMFNLT